LVVSLLYLLFRRALALAALRLRSHEFKELEIVVLRHELAVLRRQVARPRLEETDRVFLAAASRLLSARGRPSFFVRPDTLPVGIASLYGDGGHTLDGSRAGQRSQMMSFR
jgi:putative transposase